MWSRSRSRPPSGRFLSFKRDLSQLYSHTPQLVIVGKQSAGKSSLLESLTDIPFPVGDELCTRFATRIVSRRTEPEFSDSIRISIEPGDINPFNREENEAGAEAFVHTLESLTRESFADVIEKVRFAFDKYESFANFWTG